MKKILFISALLLIVNGCTTYLTPFKECNWFNETGLEKTVACAKKNRQEYCSVGKRCSENAQVTAFYNYADYLVYQVNNKQITEEEGKQALINAYNNEANQINQDYAVALGAASDIFSGRDPDYVDYGNQSTDYDWDWDGFYDQYGNLTWRCRGIQTGRFADNYKCAADIKTDTRWPNK